MNILFATSEFFPLVKIGGLADVSSSLSESLSRCGHNVTVIMPGYRQALSQLPAPSAIYEINGYDFPPETTVQEYVLESKSVRLLLVVSPDCYDRDGIYADACGADWQDNAMRFSVFARAVVSLLDPMTTNCPYQFDVVHSNDWQCGLIPAWIVEKGIPVKSIFTIHNLAYQGIFDRGTFDVLDFPGSWWHYEKLEFYNNFSFLKAGIVFANQVTTVSPTYAKEILNEPQACGMSGLLQHYQGKLTGILNGIDDSIWNPSTDPYLNQTYSAENMDGKAVNKQFLQKKLGLKPLKSALLVGVICRFVHQKGIDFIIEAIDALKEHRIQWAILGTGEQNYEDRLQALAQQNPLSVSVTLAYDESLAHQIEAGADVFAMPSRYEPCGLNQFYSMAYGTVPVVRNTGGLNDSVIPVTEDTLLNHEATGFVFEDASSQALCHELLKAQTLLRKKKAWNALRLTAMAQSFTWENSAQRYIALYKGVETVNGL